MIRYPLYKGGYIILPEPAIKTLYIIDKASKLRKSDQLELIELGVGFDIADNGLNEVRNEFLSVNGLSFPQSVKEIINILIESGVLSETDECFTINYKNSIEFSSYSLTGTVFQTIAYVRAFFSESKNMMEYINRLNMTNREYIDNTDSHVIFANSLLESETDINAAVHKATFVYEVSLLSENIKSLKEN